MLAQDSWGHEVLLTMLGKAGSRGRGWAGHEAWSGRGGKCSESVLPSQALPELVPPHHSHGGHGGGTGQWTLGRPRNDFSPGVLTQLLAALTTTTPTHTEYKNYNCLQIDSLLSLPGTPKSDI